MMLRAISPREASIFACAADALLAPEPDLPPISRTTTVAGFDSWLAASPAINRLGMRAGLLLLEVAPIPSTGRRLRRLGSDARREFLGGRRHPLLLAVLVDTLRMFAAASYYGDDEVARLLGYDADQRVARGRELRAREGRP